MIPAVAIDVTANVIFEARDIFLYRYKKKLNCARQKLLPFALRLGYVRVERCTFKGGQRRQNRLAESRGLAWVGLGGAPCGHGDWPCVAATTWNLATGLHDRRRLPRKTARIDKATSAQKW